MPIGLASKVRPLTYGVLGHLEQARTLGHVFPRLETLCPACSGGAGGTSGPNGSRRRALDGVAGAGEHRAGSMMAVDSARARSQPLTMAVMTNAIGLLCLAGVLACYRSEPLARQAPGPAHRTAPADGQPPVRGHGGRGRTNPRRGAGWPWTRCARASPATT